MRRDSFKVTDDGSTPEKPLERCFYCRAPVETEHETGCVMRRRTVVLRSTVEFVAEIPENWTAEAVRDFYVNGRWCFDNLPVLFAAHVGNEDHGLCLCGTLSPFDVNMELVREATEIDESWSAVHVDDFTD